MLRQIRKSAESPLVKFMLVLLALSFVGWGVGDYITGGRSNVAMRINGQSISGSEVAEIYQNELAALQRQIGIQLPAEMIQQLQLDNQVISAIIQKTLLEQEAKALGLGISNSELTEIITTTEAFHGEDGTFNADVYRQTLATYGLSVEGYEADLRSSLLRNRLAGLFNGPAGVKEIVSRLLTYEQEGIEVETLTVAFDDIPAPKTVSEEELTAAFEKENLHTQETRSAEIIFLSADGLEKPEVSESEILEYYSKNQGLFQTEAERRARHILVPTEEEANRIYEKLQADSGIFRALARTHSKDPGSAEKGGDLGFFGRGAMVPEFEKAVFALAVNEISQPVKSAFGYHVIQLTDIKESRTKAVEEVSKEITTQLGAKKMEEAFFNQQQSVEDRIAGGETFATIAKEVKTAKHTTHTNISQETVAEMDEIMQTVFSATAVGEAGHAQTLADGRIAFVKVTDIVAPRPLSLEEAKEMLTKNIKRLKQKQGAYDKAQAHIAAWEKGEKVAGSALQPVILRNGENAPSWLNANIITNLFALEAGKPLANPILAENSFMAAKLVKKNPARFSPAELESTTLALNSQINNDLHWQQILGAFSEASISYNIPTLRRVFGENFTGQNLPETSAAPWYAFWKKF